MKNNIPKDEHFEFEASIMRRLSAFRMFMEEGLEDAYTMYPREKEFLIENQNKTYTEIKKELFTKLERV